jgi:hypothetical protein
MTEAQWHHFGELQRQAIGDDTRRYLPWLLDDLSDERAACILGLLPGPARKAYGDEWQVAYVDLDPWGFTDAPTTP